VIACHECATNGNYSALNSELFSGNVLNTAAFLLLVVIMAVLAAGRSAFVAGMCAVSRAQGRLPPVFPVTGK